MARLGGEGRNGFRVKDVGFRNSYGHLWWHVAYQLLFKEMMVFNV